MKISKEEWKKIGKEAGWDRIYTDNGYDPPIEKTAQSLSEDIEYDDDYSPENDLMNEEKTGVQDGIDYAIDLADLFGDPLNTSEISRLDIILTNFPDLEVSVDYEIKIDEAEPENNYPRQVVDVNLTPHISNTNINEESKEFILDLVRNSLSIKQQIASRYGDSDYNE